MKAYELLDSPEKWCQNSMAEDASGAWTDHSGDTACRWCVLGALRRCYPDEVALTHMPSYQALLQVIPNVGYGFIGSWNDAPERTWQEVYDALKKADV